MMGVTTAAAPVAQAPGFQPMAVPLDWYLALSAILFCIGLVGVLAFLLDGEERASYYVPVSEYLEMAEDRGESGLRLEIAEHAKWLEKYAGHAGVRRAFARLLG